MIAGLLGWSFASGTSLITLEVKILDVIFLNMFWKWNFANYRSYETQFIGVVLQITISQVQHWHVVSRSDSGHVEINERKHSTHSHTHGLTKTLLASLFLPDCHILMLHAFIQTLLLLVYSHARRRLSCRTGSCHKTPQETVETDMTESTVHKPLVVYSPEQQGSFHKMPQESVGWGEVHTYAQSTISNTLLPDWLLPQNTTGDWGDWVHCTQSTSGVLSYPTDSYM